MNSNGFIEYKTFVQNHLIIPYDLKSISIKLNVKLVHNGKNNHSIE
jgi:hypothetical protein